MKKSPFAVAVLFTAFAAAGLNPASAQTVSPQQIQGQIASGQEQTALSELHAALQAHPDSGVAWYLTAEAQDASGNEAAAGTALANAQHYAPGLPFANPADVAALQSHIAGGNGAPVAHRPGISPVFLGIIGLVVLFFALRLFRRPRRFIQPPGYPGYGQGGAPGPYPYNQGPGGIGGGIGSSILGGLAAGAGFAAGERVIGDMFGNGNGNGNANAEPLNGNFQQDPIGIPDRDDGLQGNPGWDNSDDQGGGFDPGNNW